MQLSLVIQPSATTPAALLQSFVNLAESEGKDPSELLAQIITENAASNPVPQPQ